MAAAPKLANYTSEANPRPVQVRPPSAENSLDLTRRIPELDGLRGIAIGIVVYMHFVWFALGPNPAGFAALLKPATRPLISAVDLFFILSGLLIGGNLLDARESPRYFKTFYIRRFCRVLPVYFLSMAVVGLAYRFVYRSVGAPLDWAFAGPLPWYSYISFAQNLWMAKWNTVGPPVLSLTWAFAVEVQFYMIIPIVIRLVRRSALPYVFIAGIALAPMVRLLITYRFRDHIWATYVLLPSRMDALFLGLLCAYYLRDPRAWAWLVKRRRELWIGVFALLLGIPVLNTSAIPFTLLWLGAGYTWMALLYAAVLVLALVDSKSPLGRVVRQPWLTNLGTISYGVYLFHFTIFSFCMWALKGHWLTGWRELGIVALATGITVVAGELSWRYFEKPIVRWSHGWRY